MTYTIQQSKKVSVKTCEVKIRHNKEEEDEEEEESLLIPYI
jgi:hypothetical protein